MTPRRYAPRRLLGTLAALWALAAAAAPSPCDPPADLVETLRELGPGPSAEELQQLTRELSRAPGVVSAWLDLSAAGALPSPPGEPEPLTPAQAHLLEELAGTLPPEAVRREIGASFASRPDPPWRAAALGLLARHAMAAELPLLLDLVGEEDGRSPQGHALLEAFQESVTAVLRRDSSAFGSLRSCGPLAAPVAVALVRAAGASGDAEGLPWLVSQLGDPYLVDTALQELGRLACTSPPSADAERLGRPIKPFLDSDQATRRKHAMRALAALGDSTAAPALVAALETSDRGERRAAFDALRELSGRRLPDDVGAWRAWLADELRWWREESVPVRAALASEDAAEVVAAIHSVSARSLRRDDLARDLAGVLRAHGSSAVRRQACLALAQLGSRSACAELLDALGDADPVLRQRACSALRAITGLALPPDRPAWEAALLDQSRSPGA